jgi:hypothetical protein
MARELSPSEAAMQRTDFTRPSEATDRPLDAQGIPFLTNADVAPTFGISHVPNSKHAAYKDVPHYVEKKGDRDQNGRTWYSMGEIVSHLATKSGHGKPEEQKSAEELSYGPRHKLWNDRHQSALAELDRRRKSGEKIGNLHDQPHPGNKDIHTRLFRGVRTLTLDDPEFGNRQGRTLGTGSNVENPIRHGHLKPVGGDSTDTTDFLNASRPSRIQRRGKS